MLKQGDIASVCDVGKNTFSASANFLNGQDRINAVPPPQKILHKN